MLLKTHLSPSEDKQTRRYAVSLEAKSKKKEGAKLKTKIFGVSTIVRHRDEAKCDHAVVVAPAFDHSPGKDSALAKEIKADRESTLKNGNPKTITAIHIEDLARLVQLQPLRQLGLAKIRELFQTCSMPEECKVWIDGVEQTKVVKPPYEQIVKAIDQLQDDSRNEPVGYGEARNELKHAKPPIKYEDL